MRTLALLLFVVAVVEGFVIWTLWTHRAPCAPAPAASPQGLAPSGPAPDASASTSGGATNASVSGDLNQVPDPNCVAKTTASLLSTDRASARPSCAPMNQPPQLRQAAKQLQGGTVPASSP